jgi:two-component system, cell cycle sensor histidine kinase and response regulator CckA
MGSRLLSFKRGVAAKSGRRAKPIRVLIVDDDENMRLYVERVLRDAGYETQTAEDGDVAIAVAGKSEPFDLLVTDEMMPRMVGHQLARYMRERYLDIKVLYLSGFREELFKAKGSLWADEAFVEKPCTPEGLVQAVSMLLFGKIVSGDEPSQSST